LLRPGLEKTTLDELFGPEMGPGYEQACSEAERWMACSTGMFRIYFRQLLEGGELVRRFRVAPRATTLGDFLDQIEIELSYRLFRTLEELRGELCHMEHRRASVRSAARLDAIDAIIAVLKRLASAFSKTPPAVRRRPTPRVLAAGGKTSLFAPLD
jgi:hypothetical protein